jgi:feruloyl esterase
MWIGLFLTVPISSLALDCELASFEHAAAGSIYGVSLSSAEVVDNYCRVEGQIANAENGQSQIKFRYRFPETENWNGKFMMSGNGGTAGSFQSEDRIQVALKLGYATGQTDTGHISVPGTAQSWMIMENSAGVAGPNTTAIEDFAHRSIHLTTLVGKAFTDVFYAQAADNSYYLGCSTGGRQGLKAIQRYPNDFDGVIAGAPVYDLIRLNMSQIWAIQLAENLEQAGESLTREDLGLIHSAALNTCDALDGVADQIIDNPLQCNFDPGVLSCDSAGAAEQCLSAAQVDFVRDIYQGPTSETGEQLYPGRTIGSEFDGTNRGGWSDLLNPRCSAENGTGRCDLAGHAWFQDPDMDWVNDFSIDNPEDVAAADASFFGGVMRADNPDVSAFIQAGGKAILYHGFSDTSVTPINTVNLYKAMDATVSARRGISDIEDNVRLFFAPGMGHCRGGYGANNYLESAIVALDNWVTTDQAPNSIVATNEERDMSRQWCPYPEVARLKAPNLDSNTAENFECLAP